MARRWPSPIPDTVGLEPAPAAIHRYLLDADDDLATEFDVRTRLAARPGITVKVLRAAVGDCDLAPTLASLRHGYGLLILDGLIALDMRVGDRTATELVGAGDLLAPSLRRAEAMLEHHDQWRVLVPASLAMLDADFATRVRPWPQIAQTLLRRASRRTAELDEMRAITCHPRLEVRLDLLFWHLAARWGRVEPSGIKLTLPLTHRLLGQLVAAERPSISHALGRLSGAGLVTGCAGDWHLHGSVSSHLKSLASHTLCPAVQTRASPGSDQAHANPG
jgi:hypothetical protein